MAADKKRCSKCRRLKYLDMFYRRSAVKDGRASECKECIKKRGPYKPNSPETNRAAYLKYRYGLTPEQYHEMGEKQGWVCAICERDNGDRRLCVDHCHTTGGIRGLLCHQCNRLLGMWDDDIERLQTACEYLRRPAQGTVPRVPRRRT